MKPLEIMPIPLLALLAVAAILAALVVARRARRHARTRRRVVEKPNSHYTSRGAIQSLARHRWHDISLDRVHEINREEVVRLLARAEAAGVDSLRPAEWTFLDQIARIAGRQPDAGSRPPSATPPRVAEQPS